MPRKNRCCYHVAAREKFFFQNDKWHNFMMQIKNKSLRDGSKICSYECSKLATAKNIYDMRVFQSSRVTRSAGSMHPSEPSSVCMLGVDVVRCKIL